jgi:hypothetical protein
VDGLVVVPPTDGQTEETRYVIDNNFHRFYLVRGDAAGSLAAGQPADSTHWYVWKWQDESTGYPAPAALGEATRSTTWSSVKATYR